MQYDVFGPFELPRTQRSIDVSSLREHLWDECETYAEGLSRAIGLYVFSLRHGKTVTPWYVGKTCALTGFRGEAFQAHKLAHYNGVLAEYSGVPQMHFVARITPGRRAFSTACSSADAEILFVEKAVIGMALHANWDLCNKKETKYLRECKIPGLMGPSDRGRPTNDAKSLADAFFG